MPLDESRAASTKAQASKREGRKPKRLTRAEKAAAALVKAGILEPPSGPPPLVKTPSTRPGRKGKLPPIPVPDLTAGWEIPKTPPRVRRGPPPSILDLPRAGGVPGLTGPKGGRVHLPTKFKYMPPIDFALPPKKGSARAKQIEQYNQEREAARRKAAKEAREAAKEAREEMRKKIAAIPDRPGGLRGFLSDITEGRGVLGLATSGPIGLFARDDARNALLNGNPKSAIAEAIKLGRYRPTLPKPGEEGREAGGYPGFMEWLGNVNKGVNVLPSAFADVGEVAARTVASDVANRRGLIGLLTTGPIGALANPEARKALFSGNIEEALKQTVPDWDAPESETSKLSELLIKESIVDVKRAFTDPNYAYEDPVNWAFAAAIVLGPASRGVGIANTARRLKGVEGYAEGGTALNRYKTAIAENFVPGISGFEQGITRTLDGTRITAARHPFGRALQRQLDITSRNLNPEGRLGALSAPRRARRLEARRSELAQSRLQRDVNIANRRAALYINEGLIIKGKGLIGDALRRGRDSAIVMALQAPKNLDPIEGVRYAITDTDETLARGTALAPEGDLADLTVVEPGQPAYYNGELVKVQQTGMNTDGDLQVLAVTEGGEKVVGSASRFHLTNGEDRVRIPLTDAQESRLNQRSNDLKEALHELETNPKQLRRFEDSVNEFEHLGALNEDLGHVIAKAQVGSDEWRAFLDGGRRRRNQMSRRWRKQGLRVGEEDPFAALNSATNNERRRGVEELLNERMPDDAPHLMALGDRMAQAAAESHGAQGKAFSPEDYWNRFEEATSAKFRASDQVGTYLYQEPGPRAGLVRTSLDKPEGLGMALHGTMPKVGLDGAWWWGITDNGDGTVRAFTRARAGGDEWVDDLPIANLRDVESSAHKAPLRVGERVQILSEDGDVIGTGKVAGYNEHIDRGPEVVVLRDDGTHYQDSPWFVRSAGEGQGQGPIFYSKAQEIVASDQIPPEVTPEQLIATLTNQKNGVKKDDLVWTGIMEMAELYKGRKIPKEDLLNHMENSLNGMNLDEIVYSSNSSRHPDKWGPSTQHYTYSDGRLMIRTPTIEEPYYELVFSMPHKPGEQFTSGHYSGHNNIFHIRFHEIEDLDGVRSLLIDELQSDLMNRARQEGMRKRMPANVVQALEDLVRQRDAAYHRAAQVPGGGYAKYEVDDTRVEWVNSKLGDEDAAQQRRLEQVARDVEEAGVDQSVANYLANETDYRTAEEIAEGVKIGDKAQARRQDRRNDLTNNTNWEDPAVVAELERINPDYLTSVANARRHKDLEDEARRIQGWINDMESEYMGGGVPEFPWYGDAWMALAMKRLVQWAADNGQRRILWTRGHEHMVRYDMGGDKVPGLELGEGSAGKNVTDPTAYGDEFFHNVGEIEEQFAPALTKEGLDEGRFQIPYDDVIESGARYIEHEGRLARIHGGNADVLEVEYLLPTEQPHTVKIRYFDDAGDYSDYLRYDVEVTNQHGEKIIDGEWTNDELDNPMSPWYYHDFWRDIANSLEEGPGKTAAQALHDTERGQELITRDLYSRVEQELDEYTWNEFVAENTPEEGGGFEYIRDHEQGDPNRSHMFTYDKALPKVADKTFKPFGVKTFHKERAYTGRYTNEMKGIVSEEGELPAWGFDIPEEMVESVQRARQTVFQTPVDGSMVPKGALEFLRGTINDPESFALRLFDDADASTVIHELGHVGLYDLHPHDLRIIEDELQGGLKLEDWTRTEHERFARSFERYIMGEPALNKSLSGPFRALAETMQAIYATIRGAFDDLPVSQAVEEVFDRLVNPRSLDEARTYFPHRSAFDLNLNDFIGGVRLPAGGQTIGVPKKDTRAFPGKPNAEVLWETGEMLPSTGALTTQLIRRGRYGETLRIRKRIYDEGHEIKHDSGIPPGAYLVRDPNMRTPKKGNLLLEPEVERIPQRVTAATRLDEQSFRELTGDRDVDDWREALKNIVMTPEEIADVGVDMKHVRWIEPWKVESLIKDVFPSAPRGKGAATLGMANTLTRMSQIYLRPIRYLTGNVPANIVLIALTNPGALPRSLSYLASAVRNAAFEFGKGPADLYRVHPDLYAAIRAESGDVMAGAGLPEFYTQANNAYQRGERRLNRYSSELSDRLGEIADQPFRVAVWITWAKRYGYKTPEDWQHLLGTRMKGGEHPDRPLTHEEERIRDEIAQKTREDMIDFNAMTGWERQHISRFFYLWAFTRGFVKWPLTFAREYPERLAAVGLTHEQMEGMESERPLAAGMLDSRGQSIIRRPDGSGLDFSSWNPISGGVDAWNAVSGLLRGNPRGVTDYISPTLTAAGEAMFDPTQKQGWQALGEEALGTFIPSWGQQAVTAASSALGHEIETPASRRSAAAGKKGIWGTVNSIIEADRFSVGKFSPKNKADKSADWKELVADYAVTTGGRDADDVRSSFKAYWLYKEYESRVKYGVAEREGRKGLSDKEKAVVLKRVAEEVFDADDLPSQEVLDKADPEDLAEWVEAMDWMFKSREDVMASATRKRNEQDKARRQAEVAR